MVRGGLRTQRRVWIRSVQRRAPSTGRDMHDWPVIRSTLGGHRPEPLVNMRVPGHDQVHLGLMKQRKVSGVPPAGAVAADVEHRIMQKDDFPGRLGGQQVLSGERELFFPLRLEVEIKGQHVYRPDVVGIPPFIAREMHVVQVVARVLFVIADRRKDGHLVDHLRQWTEEFSAP